MTLASPPLSEARRDAIHEYVRNVRNALGLRHWCIDIPDEWPDEGEDIIAGIDPCEGRYVATLRFGTFWTVSREEQRSAVVHELLHLHHVRVTDIVRLGDYRQELGERLYNHFVGEVKREAEYMVDALTSLLEDTVALPPRRWPE